MVLVVPWAATLLWSSTMVVPGATVSEPYTWISKLFWAATGAAAERIALKASAGRLLQAMARLYDSRFGNPAIRDRAQV